jgi:hypothetical protein
VLVACLPTQPCACPPSTSLFVVFGKVLRADGQAAPGARVFGTADVTDVCTPDDAEILDVTAWPSDQGGAFRTHFRSFSSPRARCIRLVAYAGDPGVSDSVVLPELIVQFRIDRETPDSLGVVFRFAQ